MAQAVQAQAYVQPRDEKQVSAPLNYSNFIVIAIVLMFVALIYVGSHIHMTELEYNIASELSLNQQKIEEQKKLRLELAMLKSPKRIERIAMDRLQMSYPERDQIIVLKNSGE